MCFATMVLRVLHRNLKSFSSTLRTLFSKHSFQNSKMVVCNVNTSNNVRSFTTSRCNFQTDQSIEVTFIRVSGERISAKGKKGDSLLDVIVNNSLDFDAFGACEGTLTCSTCHVILKKEDFDRLPEKPTDEELDMLDLAHGLSDTLGCQIILSEDLNGLEVQVPATVNDARER